MQAGGDWNMSLLPPLPTALALFALSLPVAASEPPTLDALLSRPVSPGVVALLIRHANDARARAAWATALSDERPQVRAAAARAIGTSGAFPLAAALRAALSREKAGFAAAEEAAALASVLPADEDAALLTSATGTTYAPTVALTLAQVRGSGARAHLASVARLGLDSGQAVRFFLNATRSGRDGVPEVAQATVEGRDPVLVEGLLQAARQEHFAVPAGALEAALGSADGRLRAAACWHLALSSASGTAVPEPLRSAARAAEAREGSSPADIDAAFACQVLSRLSGGRASPQGPWLDRLGSKDGTALPDDLLEQRHVVDQLTPDERRAVSTRLTGSADGLAQRKGSANAAVKALPGRGGFGMSLATSLTPGLLSDTLAVSGCAPAADRFAAAEIAYGDDGRARQIRMVPTDLTPSCDAAASTLLTLARPSGNATPGPASPRVLLLNVDPDAVTCADETPSPQRPTVASGEGVIKEPRKVRTVNPVYPSGARAEGVNGTVIIEAVIGTSGCIRAAEVRAAPDGRLAWAALRAVSHWAYTPTLLNGTPVPVIMTITVNYRLN